VRRKIKDDVVTCLCYRWRDREVQLTWCSKIFFARLVGNTVSAVTCTVQVGCTAREITKRSSWHSVAS
jgi:hypothetical protein